MSGIEVRKIAGWLNISRELLAQHEEDIRAYKKWRQLTPEQREMWLAHAAAEREDERRSTERVPVIGVTLREKLGWSREYTQHFVQPYCTCGIGPEGWDYCIHARDLGLDGS